MARTESAALRRRLVSELEERGCIASPAVRDAFLTVPRERFVAEFAAREGLDAVYRDGAIVTKTGPAGEPVSSSSQPAIMALMLERLQVERGQRVLEIGAGTGYNAALLAALVGPTGHVTTADIDPDVAEGARTALAKYDGSVQVVTVDGRRGFPADAPYDRIIVTASSLEVPRAWFEQLADGGLLEVPLRLSDSVPAQAIPTLRKAHRGLVSVDVLCGGFMHLRGPGAAPRPASLTASALVDGDTRDLGRLAGTGLASLSEAACRRLLALALGPPRRRPLRRRPAVWPLHLFLGLAGPERRLVTYFRRFEPGCLPTAGLFERDGGSLALVGASAKRATRIDAFGGPAAEAELAALVDEWIALGRPSEHQLAKRLRIRVAFGAAAPRGAWKTLRRGECTLSLELDGATRASRTRPSGRRRREMSRP
jgi:protein-L-isoaspartate(D-aspartate) O-methyltransferase